MLQRTSDLVSDKTDESEDGEMLVSKGEGLEVDESAFRRLTMSALEHTRYVWFSECLPVVLEPTVRKEGSFGSSTVLKHQRGLSPTKRH